jgi:hypothetical protein
MASGPTELASGPPREAEDVVEEQDIAAGTGAIAIAEFSKQPWAERATRARAPELVHLAEHQRILQLETARFQINCSSRSQPPCSIEWQRAPYLVMSDSDEFAQQVVTSWVRSPAGKRRQTSAA